MIGLIAISRGDSEKCVATFTSKKRAKEYIKKATLKRPRENLEGYTLNTYPFAVRSLLWNAVECYIDEKWINPGAPPINPTL